MARKPRTNAQKNAGRNRATETAKSAARMRRFAEIEELFAQCKGGDEIVRIMMERTGLKERQVRYDIAEVYERAQAQDAAEHQVRLARARRAWVRRMLKCEEAGEQQAANYALDRLCKLDGLYAAKEIKVDGALALDMSALTDAQLEALAALPLVTPSIDRGDAGSGA